MMEEIEKLLYPEPEPTPETWGESPEALEAQRQAELMVGPARPRVPLPD